VLPGAGKLHKKYRIKNYFQTGGHASGASLRCAGGGGT
jgi:hypothetical protein